MNYFNLKTTKLNTILRVNEMFYFFIFFKKADFAVNMVKFK